VGLICKFKSLEKAQITRKLDCARPDYAEVGISDSISNSLNLYIDNIKEYFLFWAIPAILFIGIFLIIEAMGFTSSGEDMDMEDVRTLISILIPLLILTMVIQILFSGGVIAMTLEAMKKGTTSPDIGFDLIKKRGGRIFITSIVVSLVIGFGTLLCIIPGILFCYWYFFAVTVVALEGYSVGDAMSRSKEFSRSHSAFLFIVVLIIVVIIIYIIGSVISTIITFGAGDTPYVGTIISGIISWLIAPYIYVATAYYYIKGRRLDTVQGTPQIQPMPPQPPMRPQDPVY